MKWFAFLLVWVAGLACGEASQVSPPSAPEAGPSPDPTPGVTTALASDPTPGVTTALAPDPIPAVTTTLAPDPTPGVTTTLATKAGPPQATAIREALKLSETRAPAEWDTLDSGPLVRIGSAEFAVELAITSQEQIQGLSDRLALAPDTGMLFVYEQEGHRSFWMKNMHFPLDILWISEDCTVAGASLNVPPPEPGQALAQLPTYSPEAPVQYVLEINAGEVTTRGVTAGDQVEFTGDLAGRFSC